MTKEDNDFAQKETWAIYPPNKNTRSFEKALIATRILSEGSNASKSTKKTAQRYLNEYFI